MVIEDVDKTSTRKPTTKEYLEDFEDFCLKILDFNNFIKNLSNKSPQPINEDDVLSTGITYLMDNSYKCISNIDLTKKRHITTVKKYKTHNFIHCLNYSIKHFEQNESFEKCSFLLKIKNINLGKDI